MYSYSGALRKKSFLSTTLDKTLKTNHEIKEHRFSMEYVTADFLQFWSTTVKICLLGDRLVHFHQLQSFQRFP